MSSHREARAGSWRALVEQEQHQARALDATRAAAKAVAGSDAEAAEPVLGPWPFAGVESPSGPWVAPGAAARAYETTHRHGLSA